jgi:radical SAM-linked protein
MRIRISFSKSGPMQFVGHLDLFRAWERTFRRSGLPLGYSQGFHPQPHLNLACALPLGFTSQCELLDAWLIGDFQISEVQEAISAALPPGLEINAVEPVDGHAPALQTLVTSAVYTITFLDNIPDINMRMNKILRELHLPRQRRDRDYDLRPLIEEIRLLPLNPDQLTRITVQLAAREGATGRPEELLDELGVKFENTRIHREKLILRTS